MGDWEVELHMCVLQPYCGTGITHQQRSEGRHWLRGGGCVAVIVRVGATEGEPRFNCVERGLK